MNVLVWHVHGSWLTAFVQGAHRYLIPVVPDRGPEGRGRAQTWTWPSNAIEVAPTALHDCDVDVVILQRPEDELLATAWLGRRPGRDLPAIWMEHNAPQGRINELRHPAADRADLHLVHVTHTNNLLWDSGTTPSTVIEHGIVDPGYCYEGGLARLAAAINEPGRRARVTGSDLLVPFSKQAPIDLFGIGTAAFAEELRREEADVTAHEDLPQHALHRAMAERRVYLHPIRWTSLGLSLIEAMHLGMPVVALAMTDVYAAVPPQAGVVSNDLRILNRAIRDFVAEPELARLTGKAARVFALEHYGLDRFLSAWDNVLEEVMHR